MPNDFRRRCRRSSLTSSSSRPAWRRARCSRASASSDAGARPRRRSRAQGDGYATACLACHNTDGSGIRRSLPTTDLGYVIPRCGQRQLQRRRRHGPADHGGELHPFQHAARRRLPSPAAHGGAGAGTSRPMSLAAAAAQGRSRQGLPQPVGEAGSTRPTAPMPTASAREQHKYGPFAPIGAAIARLKAEKEGSAPAPR